MAVATLSVDIEARLAKLEAGMTQAARIAEKNSARIEGAFARTGKLLAGLGAAAAGAFSVGAVAAFVRSTVEGIDALNDFADAVGTSVENASALEDAARRTGTGMDVVTTAAVKLNQTLKDATADSPAAQALKAIGLNAEELRRQDPAEALLQVAKALDGFADDGNKARLVMELFGKSAREVAPFLKDLAEQQQLVATVTTEQAKEAEKLAREWAILSKNAEDLARMLAGPLISAMNRVTEAFRNGAAEGKSFFEILRTQLPTSGGIAAAFRGDAEGVRRARIDDLQSELRLIEGRISSLDKLKGREALLNELLEKRRSITNELAEFLSDPRAGRSFGQPDPRPSVGDTSKARDDKKPKAGRKEAEARFDFPDSLQSMLDRINASDEQKLMRLRDTLEEMRRFVEGGGTLPDSVFASIAEDIAKLDPEAQKAAAAAKELTRAMEEGKQIFQATRTPAELLQQQIEKLNELLQQGAIDWDTYARATFEAHDAFDKATAKTADKAKEVDDVARELGLTFSSAFEDAIVEGENLRGVLQGLEKDILRIVTRKLVTEPLANAVTGLLGGGGIGDIFGKIGGLFAGGFAEGGFIPPGQWGIVGERGPELAFGGRSGKTISAGMQVTNVFHLAGPADARTQQQIAAAAARGVAQASRRGN